MVKRERWTEQDLAALPPGENDVFERKSGQLLNDIKQFDEVVSKALSAFANSGGGSLILGIDDNGNYDGVISHKGRTPIREWIEQKVPGLLDYPLRDFRVHIVEKINPSAIPGGREVIVIDVGDSSLAPHQSKPHHRYFYRVSGHSKPAPHFYIELLRQRPTNPDLKFSLIAIDLVGAYETDGILNCELDLKFEISNNGHVTAYKWHLGVKKLDHEDPNIQTNHIKHFFFGRANFPIKKARASEIALDRSILPDVMFNETRHMAIQLRAIIRDRDVLRKELDTLLGGLTLYYRIATENSPGAIEQVPLRPVLDVDALVARIKMHCPGFIEAR